MTRAPRVCQDFGPKVQKKNDCYINLEHGCFGCWRGAWDALFESLIRHAQQRSANNSLHPTPFRVRMCWTFILESVTLICFSEPRRRRDTRKVCNIISDAKKRPEALLQNSFVKYSKVPRIFNFCTRQKVFLYSNWRSHFASQGLVLKVNIAWMVAHQLQAVRGK